MAKLEFGKKHSNIAHLNEVETQRGWIILIIYTAENLIITPSYKRQEVQEHEIAAVERDSTAFARKSKKT